MLRLHQIRLTLADAAKDDPPYRALAAARLRVPEADILSARLARKSVDARDKRDVYFSLSLDVALASQQAETHADPAVCPQSGRAAGRAG